MIEVTSKIKIREQDLQIDAIRASGPGGQNVNKVSTAIQLRYRVSSSTLPEPVKTHMLKIAGRSATARGEVVILAKRYRTREQNLADALKRLKLMIRAAMSEPKPRKKTKPTIPSNEVRLSTKKKRGELKISRKKKPGQDEG